MLTTFVSMPNGVRRRTVSDCPSTCNASTGQPKSSFWSHADPVTAGGTGTRFFASDTRGTIFFDTAAAVADPITSTYNVVQ